MTEPEEVIPAQPSKTGYIGSYSFQYGDILDDYVVQSKRSDCINVMDKNDILYFLRLALSKSSLSLVICCKEKKMEH